MTEDCLHMVSMTVKGVWVGIGGVSLVDVSVGCKKV